VSVVIKEIYIVLQMMFKCEMTSSVRTLKNYFKSTGRNLNDVLKYTVDGSDVLATRVETSVPIHGIIT